MTTPLRRYDALVCDIDGCLAPETSDPFDLPTLATIARHNRLAQDHGDRPVVTVCSGRPQPFAEAMCRLLANRTLPCVAENGVWLYDPRRNRYEMDPAITPDHLAAIDAARRWVTRDLGPLGVVMQPGKSASISLYHERTAVLHELMPSLRARFDAEGWPLRVSMTWFYINCDLAHVSKGTGLDRLTDATGLTRDRLAGVGDTPSDAAIADRVAFFACPANAQAELTPRAHYVSPHPEAAGVVDILDRLSRPA